MPAESPPRFMRNKHQEYPDDDTVKRVYLQAAGHSYPGFGDRHVLIWWTNGACKDAAGNKVGDIIQIIQLSGNVGSYAFYSPLAHERFSDAFAANEQFLLGDYTRSQRDQILRLADDVVFCKKSTVNSCRTWTKDLLRTMVKVNLLTERIFEHVSGTIPLKDRIAEV